MNALPEGSNILIVCDLEKSLSLHMLPKLSQMMLSSGQALAQLSPVRFPELENDVWPWLLQAASNKGHLLLQSWSKETESTPHADSRVGKIMKAILV